MPRMKRPLGEADKNATPYPKTRTKVPKLKNTEIDTDAKATGKQKSKESSKRKQTSKDNENSKDNESSDNESLKRFESLMNERLKRIESTKSKYLKLYPNYKAIRKYLRLHVAHPIDESIAERFEERSFDPYYQFYEPLRRITTYDDLNLPEIKELLAERRLPISGKKSVLVERLEQWDKKHPSGERKVGDDYKEAIGRQPVPIGAKASEVGYKEEDPHTTIERRGPNGPPVYDELGFELDYKKCMGGPVSKSARVNGMQRAVDRQIRESDIKARVMGFTSSKELPHRLELLWNDRVSKDLNIPYHKVTGASFEEWQERGFKVQPGELDPSNITEAEEERLDFLRSGSALRK